MLETNTKKQQLAMYSLAKLCCSYNNVIKYHEKDFDYQTNSKEPLTWKTQGARLCYLIMVQWAHVKFVNMHENGRFSLESVNSEGWEQNTACRIITLRSFIFMNNIKSTVKKEFLTLCLFLLWGLWSWGCRWNFFFQWPESSGCLCILRRVVDATQL